MRPNSPPPHEPHVVFGAGSEARVADALVERGATRVLLIALPHHRAGADRVADALGERCVAVFAEARPHVPLATAEAAREVARESQADWVVAHGGGTCVGIAKAVALTVEAPDGAPVRVGAVPTTYAGSERTSIWGITGPDGKVTGRDPRVRPQLVVYDPVLTLALPVAVSLESLFNALAQVTSRLLTRGGERDADALAALPLLIGALDAVATTPGDLGARSEALRGAALAGLCIERVDLGLQHALAHTLGGRFGARHSAAHTVALPCSLALDLPTAPGVAAALSHALGPEPADALRQLARRLGLPWRLADLGLSQADLPRLAERTLGRGYAVRRSLDRAQLLAALKACWSGEALVS